MEEILLGVIKKAIADGDIFSVLTYGAVYYFIWKEVNGMKKELHNLNTTVSKSFAEGEQRFTKLEIGQVAFDDRLVRLELAFNKQKRGI